MTGNCLHMIELQLQNIFPYKLFCKAYSQPAVWRTACRLGAFLAYVSPVGASWEFMCATQKFKEFTTHKGTLNGRQDLMGNCFFFTLLESWDPYHKFPQIVQVGLHTPYSQKSVWKHIFYIGFFSPLLLHFPHILAHSICYVGVFHSVVSDSSWPHGL